MMDKIIISGAKFLIHLGVSDDERRRKQEILIDCELFCDTRKAGLSDALADTVNYSDVHRLLQLTLESTEWHLIEAVAEQSAAAILKNFDVLGVRIIVKKSQRPLKHIDYCAVDITRMRHA